MSRGLVKHRLLKDAERLPDPSASSLVIITACTCALPGTQPDTHERTCNVILTVTPTLSLVWKI